MRISKLIKFADVFSIANFVFGILSIIFSIRHESEIAAALILSAVVMDFVDGKVARMTGSANEFGKQLDSLADVVSFGIAPAIFGYCLGLSDPLAIVVLLYFASCGMLRLARFNTLRTKDFVGVPITINGILFPVLFYFMGLFNNYILVVYFVMGLLMISTVKIKKR